MAKRMINRARRWRPKADDPHGENKRRLVDYLVENEITAENPITLKELLRSARFSQRYTREALQHNLLGPLRRDPQLFVGTSNRGVFLVTSRIDVDTTLEFYTSRIWGGTPSCPQPQNTCEAGGPEEGRATRTGLYRQRTGRHLHR